MIKFEEAEIPTDTIPQFDDADEAVGPGMSDRRCKVCGEFLPETAGRGRKPTMHDECRAKTKAAASTGSGSTRGSNQDVTKALNSMETIYRGMILAANLLAPRVAVGMSANLVQAQNLNRQAFEADRKLARKVANLAAPGGMAAFLFAQGLMVSPILLEIKNRPRKPKPPKSVPVMEQAPQTDLSMFE